MKAVILGRSWRIERVKVPGCRGECDPPDKPGKAIRIDPNLDGEALIEVATHEALHAALWHLDEDFVTQYAKDVARLLTRLGFKRV